MEALRYVVIHYECLCIFFSIFLVASFQLTAQINSQLVGALLSRIEHPCPVTVCNDSFFNIIVCSMCMKAPGAALQPQRHCCKYRFMSTIRIDKMSISGLWGEFLAVSRQSTCQYLISYRIRGRHSSKGAAAIPAVSTRWNLEELIAGI